MGRDQKSANGHDRKVGNRSRPKSVNRTWPNGANGSNRKVENVLCQEKCKWVVIKRMWTNSNQNSVNELWLTGCKRVVTIMGCKWVITEEARMDMKGCERNIIERVVKVNDGVGDIRTDFLINIKDLFKLEISFFQ